jgi:hypothetical protein
MIFGDVLPGIAFVVGSGLVSAGMPDDASFVREERSVTVDGVKETWRLVWQEPPEPECDAASLGWFTCPCAGFAFGEKGNLDLVRLRGGREVERLLLTPLFGPDFAFDGKAIVPRFPVRKNDLDAGVDGHEKLEADVPKRRVVTIMDWRDYDHDGQAAEFFLQVASLPCGKEMGIVIGVSRRRPALHAFGTIENPDKPVLLLRSHWADLARAKGPIQRLLWACGDHGSDERTEVFMRADEHGIHASRRDYECREDGGRGPILREEWQ